MLTSEIVLYAFLFNECNCDFWRMTFECSSNKICKTLRMSKQTLVDARKRLSDKGLVDFIPGNSKFTVQICITRLDRSLDSNMRRE